MKKKIIKSALALFLFMNLGLTIQGVANAELYYDTLCWSWDDDCIVVESAEIAAEKNAELETQKEESGEAGAGFSSVKSPSQRLSEIGGEGENGLPSFNVGQHPDAPPDYERPGVGAISSPIYFVIDLFRYVLSGIALVVILYMAIKLISTTEEAEMNNAKVGIEASIYGFIIVQIADVIVRKMFFGEYGEAFEDLPTSQDFGKESSSQIRGIIGLVHMFLAAAAVLAIVIRGVKLLTSVGSEEELTKAKNHVLYAVIGLILVGISELLVRGFIFPDEGNSLPNAEVGKRIIIMLTNYLSGFVAIVSFVALLYGGYRYVISAGSDDAKETFKKIIISVVIGLLLSIGAFAIVNTFVKLDSENITTESTP